MDGIKLSKEEKFKLVKEAHEKVLEELGPELKSSVSQKFITLKVLEKLPLEPIYDIRTIGQIISGHYT